LSALNVTSLEQAKLLITTSLHIDSQSGLDSVLESLKEAVPQLSQIDHTGKSLLSSIDTLDPFEKFMEVPVTLSDGVTYKLQVKDLVATMAQLLPLSASSNTKSPPPPHQLPLQSLLSSGMKTEASKKSFYIPSEAPQLEASQSEDAMEGEDQASISNVQDGSYFKKVFEHLHSTQDEERKARTGLVLVDIETGLNLKERLTGGGRREKKMWHSSQLPPNSLAGHWHSLALSLAPSPTLGFCPPAYLSLSSLSCR
jgi:hypothetical protein